MHGEAWELCFDDWGMFRYDFGGFGVLKTRLGMAQGWGPRPKFEEAGVRKLALLGTAALDGGHHGPSLREPRGPRPKVLGPQPLPYFHPVCTF